MFKIIGIILIAAFIISNLGNIAILALKGLVVYVCFKLHPLLGMFVAYAYIVDMFDKHVTKETKQEQRKSEQQEEQERQRREQQRKQYEESKRKQEYYRQQQYRQNSYKQTQSNTISYFTGCTTKEQLKKRHRELCKKYHPDKGGNEETFKRMQAEYEKLKIRL